MFNVNRGTLHDAGNMKKFHVYVYEVHQEICSVLLQKTQTAKHCSHDTALKAGVLVTHVVIPPELLQENT
jgi:hypothetical protein